MEKNNKKMVVINYDLALSLGMNFSKLKEIANEEFAFEKFEEGVDYKWHIGYGDNFPTCIEILNKDIENDLDVIGFLDFILAGEEEEEL